MYKSLEIRWFSRVEHEAVSAWFDQKKGILQAVEPRTDYYLPLPEKEDVNIKLREGKIEIKLSTGLPRKIELTPKVSGFLENWVKWSFELSEADALSKSIIENKKYDWIEVWKKRKALIISRGEDGRIQFQGLGHYLSFGCQIEYTCLLVKGQEWFTFCLEWFGDQYLDLEPAFVAKVLGDTVLKEKESMGYQKFLNSIFF